MRRHVCGRHCNKAGDETSLADRVGHPSSGITCVGWGDVLLFGTHSDDGLRTGFEAVQVADVCGYPFCHLK